MAIVRGTGTFVWGHVGHVERGKLYSMNWIEDDAAITVRIVQYLAADHNPGGLR